MVDAFARIIALLAKKQSKENKAAIDALAGGMKYKGGVANYAALVAMTGQKVGWVYTTLDNGKEYVWGAVDGANTWIEIGSNHAEWGKITGSLASQTDLSTALNSKLEANNLKTVNGNSLIGTGNIAINTYQPFPNGELGGTLEEVVEAIMNFPSIEAGMAYLGSIHGSCTPFGYGNVECTVTFMVTGIAVIYVSSADINPFHWEYNTASGDYIWKAYETQENKVTNINASSTDAQYPTAKAVYNYHDESKQDNLTAGSNVSISNNTIGITSGSASNGKVLTSNGSGGATWETLPEGITFREV